MTKQIITTPNGERLVVLPEAEYLTLVEAQEELEDIAAVDTFKRKLAAGEEEMIPSAIVDRILDGENKVRVWREHRGLAAKDLAAMVGISAAYLSQIEKGTRDGSFETIKRIAAALRLSVDDLA
ncbi:MAG: helix-turn-helix transcriptional regulator [Rhizobiales bacterium]|nr:helix-turn-helix transcriptional regulator [Hyphomicrobiales bacterium]